jgi:hypothetical protein
VYKEVLGHRAMSCETHERAMCQMCHVINPACVASASPEEALHLYLALSLHFFLIQPFQLFRLFSLVVSIHVAASTPTDDSTQVAAGVASHAYLQSDTTSYAAVNVGVIVAFFGAMNMAYNSRILK